MKQSIFHGVTCYAMPSADGKRQTKTGERFACLFLMRTAGANVLFHDFHWAVVVAMFAVLMMQAAIDDVVDVVAVWHGFVSAAFAVNVFAAVVCCVAGIGVGVVYVQTVFVVMAVVFVVQMSVMQIVYMVAVFDGGVSAVFAVNVFMVGVCGAAHDVSFRLGLIDAEYDTLARMFLQ